MGGTFRDIRYANTSARCVCDLVVPQGPPTPLVVFIHGGAFFMGDKTDMPRERQALVDAGFAVASVCYRYSSEAIWPAQLEDLKAAFAFLRTNGARFGYVARHIASFGASAGGHLSASIGIALAADPATAIDASVGGSRQSIFRQWTMISRRRALRARPIAMMDQKARKAA